MKLSSFNTYLFSYCAVFSYCLSYCTTKFSPIMPTTLKREGCLKVSHWHLSRLKRFIVHIRGFLTLARINKLSFIHLLRFIYSYLPAILGLVNPWCGKVCYIDAREFQFLFFSVSSARLSAISVSSPQAYHVILTAAKLDVLQEKRQFSHSSPWRIRVRQTYLNRGALYPILQINPFRRQDW
ncbi:uncharacterized protein F4807DRAFT_148150 [Annulohypoxylon truncatum]|uniref:uncharacterized protein n=1 Tax=Annulohypoxylon truncatum TaxID=327061 RepID=UPI0020087056|nr:uncharacterized protein F4807DRAFT_148150 [Annulohypoxylon truncatum]KAI1208328.1 hypothetical protein F4807DRAFT_148150 [Annulohypoxylon truncatum]